MKIPIRQLYSKLTSPSVAFPKPQQEIPTKNQPQADIVKFSPSGRSEALAGDLGVFRASGTTPSRRSAQRSLSSRPQMTWSVSHPAAEGAVGPARKRDLQQVLQDVRERKVSINQARRCYRVVVQPDLVGIDDSSTERLRHESRRDASPHDQFL